jgi:uroporphyrinogen decarboxylase
LVASERASSLVGAVISWYAIKVIQIIVRMSVFLDSISLKPTARRPVWLMRQAGRYLPEYRQLRQQAGSFLALCQNPEWACEVTLQPLRRFDLDAAIIFSDILTIPHAMGCGLHFVAGEGPLFRQPVTNEQDIQRLPRLDDMQGLRYVMDAITLTRRELDPTMPLIGFAGSPWTVACYMVQQGKHDQFAGMLRMQRQAPELCQQLLRHLAEVTARYLLAQAAAGADALMLFDSWGGLLSAADFEGFSLSHLRQIIATVNQQYPHLPCIVFSRQVHHSWSALAACGANALGIDHEVSLCTVRQAVGNRVALQGNLDPAILTTTPTAIEQGVQSVLQAHGSGPGHIFNAGHGVTPDVPPENVACMIAAVREHSQRLLKDTA